MKLFLPSPLFSYSSGRREVSVAGDDLAAALVDLDRQYPGIRFRVVDEQDAIRTHIRMFVNGVMVRNVKVPLKSDDEIHIMAALSGG